MIKIYPYPLFLTEPESILTGVPIAYSVGLSGQDISTAEITISPDDLNLFNVGDLFEIPEIPLLFRITEIKDSFDESERTCTITGAEIFGWIMENSTIAEDIIEEGGLTGLIEKVFSQNRYYTGPTPTPANITEYRNLADIVQMNPETNDNEPEYGQIIDSNQTIGEWIWKALEEMQAYIDMRSYAYKDSTGLMKIGIDYAINYPAEKVFSGFHDNTAVLSLSLENGTLRSLSITESDPGVTEACYEISKAPDFPWMTILPTWLYNPFTVITDYHRRQYGNRYDALTRIESSDDITIPDADAGTIGIYLPGITQIATYKDTNNSREVLLINAYEFTVLSEKAIELFRYYYGGSPSITDGRLRYTITTQNAPAGIDGYCWKVKVEPVDGTVYPSGWPEGMIPLGAKALIDGESDDSSPFNLYAPIYAAIAESNMIPQLGAISPRIEASAEAIPEALGRYPEEVYPGRPCQIMARKSFSGAILEMDITVENGEKTIDLEFSDWKQIQEQ